MDIKRLLNISWFQLEVLILFYYFFIPWSPLCRVLWLTLVGLRVIGECEPVWVSLSLWVWVVATTSSLNGRGRSLRWQLQIMIDWGQIHPFSRRSDRLGSPSVVFPFWPALFSHCRHKYALELSCINFHMEICWNLLQAF